MINTGAWPLARPLKWWWRVCGFVRFHDSSLCYHKNIQNIIVFPSQPKYSGGATGLNQPWIAYVWLGCCMQSVCAVPCMVCQSCVPQGATTLRVNHTRNELPCHVDVDVGGGFTSNIFELKKTIRKIHNSNYGYRISCGSVGMCRMAHSPQANKRELSFLWTFALYSLSSSVCCLKDCFAGEYDPPRSSMHYWS